MNARKAITLVELLVALAILALLVSCVLCAAIRVREMASQIRCTSNLREIGIAWHGHHLQYGILPDGGGWASNQERTWEASGAPAIAPKQAWNWTYQILPFLGQRNLHTEANDSRVQHCTELTVWRCGSKPNPKTSADWTRQDWSVCHYAANVGADWPLSKVHNDEVYCGDNPDSPMAHGWPWRETRSFSDLRTMSTILAGETFTEDNKNRLDAVTYSATGQMRRGLVKPSRDRDWDGSYPAANLGFGSSHRGGCNFVFYDGSVRTISWNIELKTFQDMCKRQ